MQYEVYMKECLELARKGYGEVSPNPLVGCVVLDKDGQKISTGFHARCGENHAERNALLRIEQGKAEGGTLVVNLEPCCHFGKTPPCTDLIIEHKLKRVVVGMLDVNPLVSGKGVEQLREAGIDVIVGVLEDECRELNEVFIKNILKSQTFVAVKTATTLDGKTATSTGSSKWITSAKAREEVARIRARYDAMMTSSETVLKDNPTMAHKNKIIIDRTLKTSPKLHKIYKDGNIFVFYDKNISSEKLEGFRREIGSEENIKLIPAASSDCKIDLAEVFSSLYSNKIHSVLVEAGGKLNGSCLKFTDKIYQFIAPKILGDNSGRSCFDFRSCADISETVNFSIKNVVKFEPDVLLVLKP